MSDNEDRKHDWSESSRHRSPDPSHKKSESPEKNSLYSRSRSHSTHSDHSKHSRSPSPKAVNEKEKSKSVSKSKSRSHSPKRSSKKSKKSRSRSRSRSHQESKRRRSRHSRSHSKSRETRRRSKHSRSHSRSQSHERRSPRNGHRRNERSRSDSRDRDYGYNRDVPKANKCLGVFGLSTYTTERELRDCFSKYGSLNDIKMVFDPRSGRSRGFAFLYYRHLEDAEEAKYQATGMEIDGKKIRVDFSNTERPHPSTPGVYMGNPTTRRYGGYGGYGGGRNGYRKSPPRASYRDRRQRSHSRSRSRSVSYSQRRY